MRLALAPSAARTASSCWRDSARTSRRFATFAHAMSMTMAIVPITTHSAPAAFPTTSCLSGRSAGAMSQVSYTCGSTPPSMGHERIQIGTIRATSALAAAIVTPGLRSATASKPKPGRMSRAPMIGPGTIRSGSTVTTRNPSGMTPTIAYRREPMLIVRPIADRSPPNRRCQ